MTDIYDSNVQDFEDNKQYAGDDKLYAIFYKRPIKNEFKSTEQGRPIFDEFDYIKILAPGSKDTFETEATQHYKDRFPKQWAKYEANATQAISGTPIDQVPWLSVGQIAELRAINVYNVEGIVSMPDSMAQKFMGFQQLKQRAQAFLDAAADAAPLERMNAALQERDDKIALLERQMAEFIAASKAAKKA